MFAIARKTLTDLAGPSLEERLGELFNCGDAESLPYGDDSMDGIFMCFTLELFDTPDLRKVLAECMRVLRPGGRIVVVAVSKAGKEGFLIHASEWTHRHFPNLMDCWPIHVRRALAAR